MEIRNLAIPVAVALFAVAHAQEFPQQQVELPALSLSGAAQEALQSRLPVMTPRLPHVLPSSQSHAKKFSNMPIKHPDEMIDAKLTIKTPDTSTDYKIRVVTPQVESSK